MTFEEWWFNVGSGLGPKDGEEIEQFAKRISYHAWMQAAYETQLETDK